MRWKKDYFKVQQRAAQRRAAIKELRASGMAVAQIAARYRISRQRVEQILKAAHETRR